MQYHCCFCWHGKAGRSRIERFLWIEWKITNAGRIFNVMFFLFLSSPNLFLDPVESMNGNLRAYLKIRAINSRRILKFFTVCFQRR